MAQHEFHFLLPAQLSFEALLAYVRQRFTRLEYRGTEALERVYWDSFDWRLYGNGAALEWERRGEHSQLCWLDLQSGARAGCLPLAQVPRLAVELPYGALRERLEPILEVRALLPQIGTRGLARSLVLLDEEQKTVLRLRAEELSASVPDAGVEVRLPIGLCVLPVKGYARAFAQMRQALETGLGLVPAAQGPLPLTLRAVGRVPATYSSRLDLRLDPDLRADVATQRILRRLLDILRANEAGTQAHVDPEFLHDYRVAVRRTRSALGQIRGVFPTRTLTRWRGEFAWLGQLTGPTRDLDVYLLKLPRYRAELPPFAQRDLEPLAELLRRKQAAAQAQLAKGLASPRYQRMLERWSAFIEAPVPRRSSLANAARPVRAVADEQLRRVYRRALRQGRQITPETPASALHELRKTCKKLRYLLEFFQSLYPGDVLGTLLKALKELQDNLGDFQDLEVQMHGLRSFGEEMLARGSAVAGTLFAMGMLVDKLALQQQQERQRFGECFARFGAKEQRRLAEGLFTAMPKT